MRIRDVIDVGHSPCTQEVLPALSVCPSFQNHQLLTSHRLPLSTAEPAPNKSRGPPASERDTKREARGRTSRGGGPDRGRSQGGAWPARREPSPRSASPRPRPRPARSPAGSLAPRKTLRRFKNGTSAA
ncbi:unnamed protein product [Rangifer tarandus platyrhynchus]|uniref:Uncharacterized protein n=1 Tax=Rangifer tarandus platyrhynchus TaxID=3082113 RepID=A0AC59Z6U3_RANTA